MVNCERFRIKIQDNSKKEYALLCISSKIIIFTVDNRQLCRND